MKYSLSLEMRSTFADQITSRTELREQPDAFKISTVIRTLDLMTFDVESSTWRPVDSGNMVLDAISFGGVRMKGHTIAKDYSDVACSGNSTSTLPRRDVTSCVDIQYSSLRSNLAK